LVLYWSSIGPLLVLYWSSTGPLLVAVFWRPPAPGGRDEGAGPELGAKLASLNGIVWVGVGLFVFGLASLVWPPLKAIIGSVTTALDRQATRINALESGLARVDERTRQSKSWGAHLLAAAWPLG
jgi:hypothetical protein